MSFALLVGAAEEAGCRGQCGGDAGGPLDHGGQVVVDERAVALERRGAEGSQDGGRVLGRNDRLGIVERWYLAPEVGGPGACVGTTTTPAPQGNGAGVAGRGTDEPSAGAGPQGEVDLLGVEGHVGVHLLRLGDVEAEAVVAEGAPERLLGLVEVEERPRPAAIDAGLPDDSPAVGSTSSAAPARRVAFVSMEDFTGTHSPDVLRRGGRRPCAPGRCARPGPGPGPRQRGSTSGRRGRRGWRR